MGNLFVTPNAENERVTTEERPMIQAGEQKSLQPYDYGYVN
jgi:hypothetical protein